MEVKSLWRTSRGLESNILLLCLVISKVCLSPEPLPPCHQAPEPILGSSCNAQLQPQILQGRYAHFQDCYELVVLHSDRQTLLQSWAALRGSGWPWWSPPAGNAHCQGCHRPFLGLPGLGFQPLAPVTGHFQHGALDMTGNSPCSLHNIQQPSQRALWPPQGTHRGLGGPTGQCVCLQRFHFWH